MSTIKEFELYSEINEVVTKKIIMERRRAVGRKSNNPSAKTSLIMNNIFKVIRDTGINEVTMSLSDLKKILKTDSTKNIGRDMKTYFRGYGIGDFASTKKYNIFKIIKDGELINNIKSEVTYVFYINKETLELMKKNNLCDDLDYDKLINDIPKSIEVLKEIEGKSATEIFIRNYVDDSYFIDTNIKINKNIVKQEGLFEKKVNINIDGETIERTNIKEEFIPKECDANPIINRLEEFVPEIVMKEVEEEAEESISDEKEEIVEEPEVEKIEEELTKDTIVEEIEEEIVEEPEVEEDENLSLQPKKDDYMDSIRKQGLGRRAPLGSRKKDDYNLVEFNGTKSKSLLKINKTEYYVSSNTNDELVLDFVILAMKDYRGGKILTNLTELSLEVFNRIDNNKDMKLTEMDIHNIIDGYNELYRDEYEDYVKRLKSARNFKFSKKGFYDYANDKYIWKVGVAFDRVKEICKKIIEEDIYFKNSNYYRKECLTDELFKHLIKDMENTFKTENDDFVYVVNKSLLFSKFNEIQQRTL